MNNEKCPCEECILIPICRHKPYFQLLDECSLLKPMYERPACVLNESSPYTNQKKILIKHLNPTTWTINKTGWICNTKGDRI